MRNFTCQCGNTVYFANTQCLSCNRPLGFISEMGVMASFDVTDNGDWITPLSDKRYRPCVNYVSNHICNWMVENTSDKSLCHSCELTKIIPDQSKELNAKRWYRMEHAKRRLLFTLISLGLPIWSQRPGKPQLQFQFLEDVEEDEYGQELTVKSTVITGHNNGMITLNLKEAEDSSRIMMRERMNERYRTLVGHFRHESGHFYWDWFVRDSEKLHEFRDIFGDERQDYTQSLQTYYKNGPAADWQERFISAYASAHPWEDWAESWAHYLHIVDTLETAVEYDVAVGKQQVDAPVNPNKEVDFDRVVEDWGRLTTVLNALNRSMGLDDAYPFLIPEAASEKLRYIHNLIQGE
ncbi:putative zinc-binding metallopeptidase [Alteromonas sp. H39]|uniref:zinc-binding metallopeptidase family protein n=1 Tax=Alteromonas sp. H39 TaxID=3389876 RepID=UPI0039E15E10